MEEKEGQEGGELEESHQPPEPAQPQVGGEQPTHPPALHIPAIHCCEV